MSSADTNDPCAELDTLVREAMGETLSPSRSQSERAITRFSPRDLPFNGNNQVIDFVQRMAEAADRRNGRRRQ